MPSTMTTLHQDQTAPCSAGGPRWQAPKAHKPSAKISKNHLTNTHTPLRAQAGPVTHPPTRPKSPPKTYATSVQIKSIQTLAETQDRRRASACKLSLFVERYPLWIVPPRPFIHLANASRNKKKPQHAGDTRSKNVQRLLLFRGAFCVRPANALGPSVPQVAFRERSGVISRSRFGMAVHALLAFPLSCSHLQPSKRRTGNNSDSNIKIDGRVPHARHPNPGRRRPFQQ